MEEENRPLPEQEQNGQSAGQPGVTGFDSVQAEKPQGYTVTPDGGFYTVRKDQIIQDETVPPTAEPQPEPKPEPQPQPQPSYRPTGSYGTGGNNFDPYTGKPIYRKPAAPQPKKTKRRFGAGVVVLAALLAAVIGAGSAFAVLRFGNSFSSSGEDEPQQESYSNVNITVDETVASAVEAVAKKATASVVGIRTTTSVFNFFGGSQEATGEGSGVIYKSDGYIITNYHVIENVVEATTESRIDVFLDGGNSKSYEAAVVGYNISSDLAVLKIKAKGLKAVELGNSDKLSVGQFVVTIGSPGGLEFMGSVTYGVISGLNRVVSSSNGVALIQTDAAINPGNSGGALLDTEGKLIGVNSSKIVSTEFEGMGFSIPVNTVIEKCDKIIKKQNEPEPYVGISFSEKYTAEILSYYGYPAGAVVLSVDADSPAEDAGIRRGDIITEFNGKEVSSVQILKELIGDCDPNASVKVKLYRSGRYYSTTVRVRSNN